MTTEILNRFKHASDIFADVITNDAEYSEAVRNHSIVKENLKPLLNPNEEFRYIAGYPNYVVTSLGRVINIKTLKVLKYNENWCPKCKGNYRSYFVRLCRNGVLKKFYVHQLVAEAFIDKPDKKDLVVNHKNHITSDNRVDNLEWVTRSENASDRICNRWTEYSLDELIEMRSKYKSNSSEYHSLNSVIYYRRKNDIYGKNNI